MNFVSRPCFDAGTGRVPCVCRWQADEGWQSASRLIRRVEVKETPDWQGWAVFPNGVFPPLEKLPLPWRLARIPSLRILPEGGCTAVVQRHGKKLVPRPDSVRPGSDRLRKLRNAYSRYARRSKHRYCCRGSRWRICVVSKRRQTCCLRGSGVGWRTTCIKLREQTSGYRRAGRCGDLARRPFGALHWVAMAARRA